VASRVLFIRNDPAEPGTTLGEAFAENGFDVDTFAVVSRDQLENPAIEVDFPDLTRYDVVVTMGGRWGVYDDALRATWVGAQMAALREAADAGVGLLGVCFGGQLLAQTFGGSVGQTEAPEVGWYDISTDDPQLIPPGPWFQWHFDRWTTPPGAVEIARNGNAPQAFVLGRTLGLQFHPELEPALLEVWMSEDEQGAAAAAVGLTHDDLRSRTKELADDSAARMRALVRGYLSRVLRAAPQS
jgi:GMP synthase-like glutamine amidotransferase